MNDKGWIKYPRTLHLPFSPGATNDDKVAKDCSDLEGKRVVVMTKYDGENTTLYRNGVHARSLDSKNHPSRDWVKNLWASVAHKIPEGWRICGENMYAKHSIQYDELPSYFMVFSVWDDRNMCLRIQDTIYFCSNLGLDFIMPWNGESLFDEVSVKATAEWLVKDGAEGLVVRNSESFHYDDFQKNVFKYVREGHVQTEDHWMNSAIEKNGLRDGD